MRNGFFELSRQRKFKPKPAQKLRQLRTIRGLSKFALVARHRSLIIIAARVSTFGMVKIKVQRRKHAVFMQYASFENSRIFSKFRIPAFIRKVIVRIIRRAISAFKFVIVVAMTCRQRRTHRNAIRQAREHLRRSFPSIVAAITQKNAGRFFLVRRKHCFGRFRPFRHKVDRTANAATAKLRRDSILIDFNLFDLIQVDCPQIDSAARRIVHRDAIHANDNVLCRHPANAHRLETPDSALAVILHARKGRQNLRCRKSTAFPSLRQNLGIARRRLQGLFHIRRPVNRGFA